MLNGLTRLLVMLGGFYAIYRYRYKIMNGILGNSMMRKTVVSLAMNIPFIRDKFMKQAFRY
ncbi:hypothetical protein PY093_10605 [Cytobacillus sp. S13-E01]|uniref:hypothetical protein n=1 Tax=Cytobacillus sp. S13-E01 TaxID=3031326 RepID=UPI0023D7B9F9|nr:hypothetical protein [Cytobacillus sp. S13-E01]MDF0727164.1 hypothetical protein [Cytobacillus sp. S13-E01]